MHPPGRLIWLLVALLVFLAACDPESKLPQVFTPENTWLDELPADAQLIGPYDFRRRIGNGGIVLTSSQLIAEAEAARQAQFGQDLRALATDAADWVLEVLGPMQLRGAGTLPLCGEKRRLLLAALLEARVSGRQGLSRLDLIELLYPEQDELKAGVNLRQLALGLRRDFGAQLLLTTPDGYALGACDSDLDRFLAKPGTVAWRGAYLAIGLEALRAAGNQRSLYREAGSQAAELGENLPQRWQDFLAEEARSGRSDRLGAFPA